MSNIRKTAQDLIAIQQIAERAIARRRETGELHGSFLEILEELTAKAKQLSGEVMEIDNP